MKTLAFFLFALSASVCLGQASSHYSDILTNHYSEGTSYNLLANDVNVRSSPSTKGEKTAKLPIATAVTLLSISDKKLTIHGLNLPWCKIGFTQEGKQKEGYVWIGFLAYTSVESSTLENTVFLVGPGNMVTKDNRETTWIQVRLATNKKEVDKLEFEHYMEYLPGSTIAHGKKGLNNVTDIFSIDCPWESWASEHFIFLNKNKLYYIGRLGFSYDSPAFQEEAYLFPDDEGGKYNRIIWTHKSGEENYEDASENDYIEEKKKEYLWSGEMLIEN